LAIQAAEATLASHSMDTTDKKFHINFWYIIAAVFGMLLIQDLYLESTKLPPIPYSRFQELLNDNKIAKVSIAQNYISGSLKEAQPDGVQDFITMRVDPDLAQSLDKHDVVYSGVVESHWLRDLLSWILPALFLSGSGCSRSGAWVRAGSAV
jgi:cell division protease FtsH